MRIRSLLPAFLFTLACSTPAFSQNHPDTSKGEDLMGLLDEGQQPVKKNDYVSATFKATRIINGHSIENVGAGVLDFRISHRFGPVSGGIDQFFGLDGATTKLGLDYGINNWLMVGIGRSTYQKEVDGFFKAKILRQTEDNRMPVSLSVLGACGIQTAQAPTVPPNTEYYFSNRVAYSWQVLVARKFTRRFSAQFMPSLVHMNLVQKADDPNNVISLGIGGRYKLSKRLSLTAEYYYNLEDFKISGTHNALAFGLDIETGGHVFQLFFTNSTGISERTFIANTTDEWSNGDIHFGFNISRVFTIVKPKDMEGTRNKIW
jgi:hypothetical protein